ncbi:MAG: hypothetical protein RBS91_10390 [Sulfurimonadaceae bacterium]|jgi:hypothetical protein|nr:hypothetical protein [Sulfurimonadaceae bacterium]
MIYKWNDIISEDLDLIQEKIEEEVAKFLPRDDIEITDTRSFMYEMGNIEVYEYDGLYTPYNNKKTIGIDKVKSLTKELVEQLKKGMYDEANKTINKIQIERNRFADKWYE